MRTARVIGETKPGFDDKFACRVATTIKPCWISLVESPRWRSSTFSFTPGFSPVTESQ